MTPEQQDPEGQSLGDILGASLRDRQKSDPVKSVSIEELEAINSGPAPFANKIYVTITPAGIRLSFAEIHPNAGSPQLRAAVLVSFADARDLIAVLTAMMDRHVRFEAPPGSSSPGTAGVGPRG